MPTDEPNTARPAHWSGLIGEVATRRDRAAFSQLFAYFAPRVKTFMQRSGLSETNAEELAQETMLMVWRKADRFDAATEGAAHGSSPLLAICALTPRAASGEAGV